MTGLEAAEIVRQMCLAAGHSESWGPGREPLVCGHCAAVAHRLKDLHREQNPVPPAVLVHFVVDVNGTGKSLAYLDEPEAIAVARKRRGVVVSVPVSSDWRNTPDEEPTPQ